MNIEIKVDDGVEIPKYATPGSAGFDLKVNKVLKLFKGNKEIELDNKFKHSLSNGYIFLRAGERVLLGTGIRVAIPEGYELQIRSRSGTSLKRGLVVTNSPGTVDSDYRGEVGIIITNTTPFLSKIEIGEAIAQGVICPTLQANFELVNELSDTQRGEGGFGSTNVNKN